MSKSAISSGKKGGGCIMSTELLSLIEPLTTRKGAGNNTNDEVDIKQWYSTNGKKQDYNGTFADSSKAPIHGWFKYPAGYSYKLVENKIREYGLNHSSRILDPFVGCGTTSVTAKEKGVNSIGIEAHSFVYWVAKVKTFWEYDMRELERAIDRTANYLQFQNIKNKIDKVDIFEYPELVRKCYSPYNLATLKVIQDYIEHEDFNSEIKDFLKLALVDTLRTATSAGAGWPYIAPSKYHEKTEKEAIGEFLKQVNQMHKDLKIVTKRKSPYQVACELILGDSRKTQGIQPDSIDLAITSPPYLNNYDYADRTRLELYFCGLANTWADITKSVRDKLMTAATTQIRRSDFNEKNPLIKDIEKTSPDVYYDLIGKIEQLGKLRLIKKGKKSYDLMVAGYFNDMFNVLKCVKTTLKEGNDFVLVLGDSAPYGVHIATEKIIGELALNLGYSSYETEILRVRGNKWKANPQRHHVLLKESILYITK